MGYVSRRDEALEEIKGHLGPVALGMARVSTEQIVGLMERSDPSGEEYPHPGGGLYEASAPGEPPAIRTGEYAESFDEAGPVESRRRVSAAVTNDREVDEEGAPIYLWRILEDGTFSMAPRPHIRPGAELAARVIRGEVRKAQA